MKEIINIKGLNKTFYSKGTFVHAINNVSFKLNSKETIGLIGESGSGKTTIGRTIMNLHRPDSGSIIINQNEYGGKLSKKNKAKLYNDVQMIFQDPYSSLNTQKNIYSILKESLIVKNKDKQILRDFISNRQEVLKFYKGTLKEKYWKGYWSYRKEANIIAKKAYLNIEKSFNKIEVDETKSFIDNYLIIKELFFNEKFAANSEILESLLSFQEKIMSDYLKVKQNTLKGKFDDYDEINLDKTNKEIMKLKKDIEFSPKEQILREKLKISEEELTVSREIYQIEFKRTKKDIGQILKNIKKEQLILRNKLLLEESQKEYIFIKSVIKTKQLIVKIIKKLKKEKIIFEDFSNILNETNKLINKQQKFDGKTITFALDDELLIEQIYSKFLQIGQINLKKYQAKIKKHENKNMEINNKIEKLKHDEKRNTTELKIKLDKAYEKLKTHVKENEEETKKYIITLNAIIESLRIKNEDNATKDTEFIVSIRANMNKLIKNYFNKIISNKNINHGPNFKTNRKEKLYIKNLFKADLSRNKKFEFELKRTWREIRYMQNFISLNNFSSTKNSWYSKRKLKSFLLRTKIIQTIQDVGLNKSNIYGYPHEFSGGMRQRVGIARAIISDPKIIVADEPIAALDLSIQAQIINLLKDISKKRNMSLIFIAHDLSMIEYNSDKIMIMHLGRLVEYGDTKEIFKNPIHPYTINLIESIPKITEISSGFTAKKFDGNYHKQYSVVNEPSYHKIKSNHFILGLEEQVKKWKK